MSCHARRSRLGFAREMADTPTPPVQSKAMIFARRSGSTLFLWALVTGIFCQRSFVGVSRADRRAHDDRDGRVFPDAACGFGEVLSAVRNPARGDLQRLSLLAFLAGRKIRPTGLRLDRDLRRDRRLLRPPTPLSDPGNRVAAHGGGQPARIRLHRVSLQLHGAGHLPRAESAGIPRASSALPALSCCCGCWR